MNQIAITGDKDYEEGKIAGLGFDLDLLKWFGIPIEEDPDYYKHEF